MPRSTTRRTKAAEPTMAAKRAVEAIEIDVNNLPQTIQGPCAFFYGGQQFLVGEGEQVRVTVDDVQYQNRYDPVILLDNAPPSHPRCCKFFAPSLSDERNGAEAPDDYRFSRLRKTLGCSNPEWNKQGIFTCQFGDNQHECPVFVPDAPQMLRHMKADQADVQVRRRREGRGTPLYALVVDEEEIEVWTGAKAENQAFDSFEHLRQEAAAVEIIPLPMPEKVSFFQKVLTKRV